jgi:phospholipase C
MTTPSIKHIVLVIFENRSFDHLLGWMRHPRYGNNPSVDGLIGDVDPRSGAIENDDYENDAAGYPFQPFFEDLDSPFLSDLPHGRDAVAAQMGFDRVRQRWTMRGFADSYFHENPNIARVNPRPPDNLRMLAPSAAPMTAFLAKNYCVCDRWFTPIPTDTHPNRFMALAGYTKIDRTEGGFPEPDHRLVFDWATANGVPWRVYSSGFSFCSLILNRLPQTLTDRSHFRRFHDFANDFQSEADFPSLVLLEPQFADDPFASAPADNHPPFPMGPGEGFLLQVYQALCGTEAARRRWAETMLVVYYDEHGGFFDHVPPLSIATPCGRAAGEPQWPGFATTGPRVPAIVASPLVEAGSVFSRNLDHTSVLRFLAERFTPGRAYDDRVRDRHASGLLDSLGAVLTRDAARETPGPPRLGPFQQLAFPNGRPALTAGQKAFLGARAMAHEDHGDALADLHPESFFVPKAS